MGQKVNPIGLRIGILEDWRSRWYARKAEFGQLTVQDYQIRKYIKQNYAFAGISKTEITRERNKVTVRIHCSRPGVIIGRKGQEVVRLSNELSEIASKEVDVRMEEIERPELEAQLVAESIAEQLERRAHYRRTMKRAAELTMQSGLAKGIKIKVSGRLAGAEIARSERLVIGQVPLHTLRAKIDYGFAVAKTTYGTIGVKVWINRGIAELEKEDSDASDAETS